jgi:hypothetical protein
VRPAGSTTLLAGLALALLAADRPAVAGRPGKAAEKPAAEARPERGEAKPAPRKPRSTFGRRLPPRMLGSGAVSATEPAAAGDAGGGMTLGSQAASHAALKSAARTTSGVATAATGTGLRERVRARRDAATRPRGRAMVLVPMAKGPLPPLSTKAPGLLMILADHSGSMEEPIDGTSGITKADALADVVNGVLVDFIDRMNVGGEVRPRIDVMMHGYSGNFRRSWSESLLDGALAGEDTATIAEVADNWIDEIELPDADGLSIRAPIWVRPSSGGNSTPTRLAFEEARDVYASWKRRPTLPHLVLGVHVTDGVATDGDPRTAVAALARDVTAAGGSLLMTNIHIASNGGEGFVFPDEDDAMTLDAHGRALFEMSSPVPPELAARLKTKPGARMMAYNASFEELAKVFEAGSSVAAR